MTTKTKASETPWSTNVREVVKIAGKTFLVTEMIEVDKEFVKEFNPQGQGIYTVHPQSEQHPEGKLEWRDAKTTK